jgi:hypothetical protein
MTSKQRVFSTSSTTNYSEYIKNKQGIENLKAIKYNPNNNSENKIINRFINYEQIIILSKSYYKYKNLDNCSLCPTTNLYNSNISYINKNDKNDENNECKLLKNVLYPYGNYESNKISNFYFPYKFNLYESCSNKKICPFPLTKQ